MNPFQLFIKFKICFFKEWKNFGMRRTKLAGRKITREAVKRLDAYGEDGIMALYMEHRL